MDGQRQFGPYTLIRQIAVGGMAEIHLAKTEGLAGFEKYVAIKMIHPNFSQDESFIQMLIDEAKISVQLQHVNIAQTFDLGRVGDTYYITMEYVDGADLYKLLRRASERELDTPVEVAAYVAKEMANGLDYAHRRRATDGQPLGIVHRDVSPQNVLVSHVGEVKLVDFGIAKATMKARQTAAGVIKGKYYYMSPEQAWGDVLDHRTDIFSLGIVLYEALTGQMLYLEEDLSRLMDMVRRANIQSPRLLRRDIPPQLERIIMRALHKNREERYQTAGDLASDLERFLHDHAPAFRPHRVIEFFHQVMEEEPPPPTAEHEALVVSPPTTASERIATTDLMRERSEFADANSVIFRISDLRPPPRPGVSPGRGRAASDSTKPIPDMEPDHVSFVTDLDGGEEQTVISEPPRFPDRADTREARDFAPTLVGDDTDDADDDEDGPTMNQAAAALPPRSSGRPLPPHRAAPGHPALAASTPQPAVSLTRPARPSRKTPTGMRAAEPPPGRSLIATLVGTEGKPPLASTPPASAQPGAAPHPGVAPQPWPADPFAFGQVGAPQPTTPQQWRDMAEFEAFSDHYKLARSRLPWLKRAALIVACVAGGAGLGVLIYTADDESMATVEIGSVPDGATVAVDGQPLADKTPVLWTEAAMGGRYRLTFERDGYEPLVKEVVVNSTEEEVLVVLDRISRTVALVIDSHPPKAQILIDGKSYGLTPRRISGLDPETVGTLELRLAGHETYRQELEWGEDKELTVTVDLPRK